MVDGAPVLALLKRSGRLGVVFLGGFGGWSMGGWV